MNWRIPNTVGVVTVLWLAGELEPAQGLAQAQVPVIAFEHVSVIPMDRERVLKEQTVVVEGDRIVAMGPSAEVRVPATAVRVDGRGKFLIPGLGDMHAHAPLAMGKPILGDTSHVGMVNARQKLFLYLANGVTTVRVMGYAGLPGLALRAEVEKGTVLGPRMYVGVGPVDDVTPDSAVRFVEAARRAGFDFVKVHGAADLDSAVAAAHRVGLPVVGHPADTPSQTDSLMGIPWVIHAGLRSIEHQMHLMTVAEATRHAAALKQAGIWVSPTLVQHRHGRGRRADVTWPERRYYWPPEWGAYTELPTEQHDAIREQQRAIKVLHDAGVGLLLGTDDIVGGVPGFAIHRELEALVAAGLTPYEALVTGTRNVAAYFGTLDSTGTVAVGKRADLVLLADNPLTNIRHTALPAGVMRGGRWLPRAELDQIMRLLERTLWRD